MARHSENLDLKLVEGHRMTVGDREVILTCDSGEGDKLPVKEIYVDKNTGQLVIVYDDKE